MKRNIPQAAADHKYVQRNRWKTIDAAMMGWNDFYHGRGHSEVYEKSSREFQSNYERGRLAAAEAAAAGLLVPWNPGKRWDLLPPVVHTFLKVVAEQFPFVERKKRNTIEQREAA